MTVDVVVHDHDDGNRYLVINVHQFGETPVVCRHNGPDNLRLRDRLTPGDFFIRPAGKPQTERITDAAKLHDLLELAAENRARRMLEVGRRVGLVPAESSEKRFEDELATIQELVVPVTEVPHWRVTIRPDRFDPDLIPTRSKCLNIVEKAKVSLRGWDFPYVPTRDGQSGQGSNWIAAWCTFMGTAEYWRLFQSGQFVHYSAVREVTESQWRDKLQAEAMNHLRHVRDVDWDSVPGFISLINLLYIVTEIFEFAARVAQAGVYEGAVTVRVEIHGIQGFVLTTDANRSWRLYCTASENDLSKTWIIPTDRLIADSASYSLAAAGWFYESFGWMEPNLDVLRKDQQEFLRRSD